MSRAAAFELFGPMRHSTPEEQQLYKQMIEKHSIPIEGVNIFNMGNIEVDYCDFCHQKKQVLRKYYHYPVNCECCGGTTHFEYVRYCKDCTPKPPKYIRVEVKPIAQNDLKINLKN